MFWIGVCAKIVIADREYQWNQSCFVILLPVIRQVPHHKVIRVITCVHVVVIADVATNQYQIRHHTTLTDHLIDGTTLVIVAQITTIQYHHWLCSGIRYGDSVYGLIAAWIYDPEVS